LFLNNEDFFLSIPPSSTRLCTAQLALGCVCELGAATKRLGALSEETYVERPRLPSPRTPACLNSEASNAHNHTVVSVRAGGARDFVSQTKRRETTHGAGLPVRETFTMMCRVSKRMRKGGEAWSAHTIMWRGFFWSSVLLPFFFPCQLSTIMWRGWFCCRGVSLLNFRVSLFLLHALVSRSFSTAGLAAVHVHGAGAVSLVHRGLGPAMM
jgi:hypothetical protein